MWKLHNALTGITNRKRYQLSKLEILQNEIGLTTKVLKFMTNICNQLTCSFMYVVFDS